MGCVEAITATRFPEQSEYVGKRTTVVFHYGNEEFPGTIIRDDRDEPYRMIFQLDDGRVVLATECQYRLPVVETNAL